MLHIYLFSNTSLLAISAPLARASLDLFCFSWGYNGFSNCSSELQQLIILVYIKIVLLSVVTASMLMAFPEKPNELFDLRPVLFYISVFVF